MDVLVFGGTTEGRELVEWLDARGTCHVVACTATEYGASLVAGGRHVTAVQGPLSAERKRALMRTHDFCCVVDATHPYAQHISASIEELAQAYGKAVVRVARAGDEATHGTSRIAGPVAKGRSDTCRSVASVREAAHLVAQTAGNVLLTTGTKELAAFCEAVPDYQERLYVRVLPVVASLERVRSLGIPTSHVVAMQGPFSARLNASLIREFDIGCMVTKESGAAGGFAQKVEAARDCGIDLVVVERPQGSGGISLEEAKNVLKERYGL